METYFVRIRCATDEHWRELQQRTELDLFPHTAQRLSGDEIEVDGLLANQQIAQLRVDSYVMEILADAQQVAYDRQQEIGQDSAAGRTNHQSG
jgi:hypothetical protein